MSPSILFPWSVGLKFDEALRFKTLHTPYQFLGICLELSRRGMVSRGTIPLDIFACRPQYNAEFSCASVYYNSKISLLSARGIGVLDEWILTETWSYDSFTCRDVILHRRTPWSSWITSSPIGGDRTPPTTCAFVYIRDVFQRIHCSISLKLCVLTGSSWLMNNYGSIFGFS